MCWHLCMNKAAEEEAAWSIYAIVRGVSLQAQMHHLYLFTGFDWQTFSMCISQRSNLSKFDFRPIKHRVAVLLVSHMTWFNSSTVWEGSIISCTSLRCEILLLCVGVCVCVFVVQNDQRPAERHWSISISLTRRLSVSCGHRLVWCILTCNSDSAVFLWLSVSSSQYLTAWERGSIIDCFFKHASKAAR